MVGQQDGVDFPPRATRTALILRVPLNPPSARRSTMVSKRVTASIISIAAWLGSRTESNICILRNEDGVDFPHSGQQYQHSKFNNNSYKASALGIYTVLSLVLLRGVRYIYRKEEGVNIYTIVRRRWSFGRVKCIAYEFLTLTATEPQASTF